MKLALKAALALSILATCGGCAQLGSARKVPADCETLAERVPLPIVTKATDARKSLAEHRAALVTADGRLDATRTCEERVRQDFAR